ncbi:MAG TPA: hypothetical protein VNE17_11395 [Nitrolancea sp.]|nr:hypothetical protein [Nitrolancea sp.]
MTVEISRRSLVYDFDEIAVFQPQFIGGIRLAVIVIADAVYPAETLNHIEIEITEPRLDFHQVIWIEPATGKTVASGG